MAGALEKNVCARTGVDKPIYPNLFATFVANPGIGKSLIISEVREMWDAAGLNVGPETVTKAAMIDYLAEASSGVSMELVPRHTALFAASELGMLIPENDTTWLNVLNHLYDCPPILEERTRGKGVIKIANPFVTILGGTQPKFLGALFPEDAYGMGFMSRLIMVYAGAAPVFGLFDARPKSDPFLRLNLEHDLKSIAKLSGEFTWHPTVVAEFGQWYSEGLPPEPTHSRMQGYNARRLLHLVKLMMCFSASRGSDLMIDMEDYTEAKDLLLGTETLIPEIFKEMTAGAHGQIIQEAHTFLILTYARTKAPIRESTLVAFFTNKVPVNLIAFNIDAMVRGGMIKETPLLSPTGAPIAGTTAYKPLTVMESPGGEPGLV